VGHTGVAIDHRLRCAFALAQSARGLLLDHAGHTGTPLRKLDTEFGAALGRVHRDVDSAVRDLMLHARFLAETYVASLYLGRIGPAGAQARIWRKDPVGAGSCHAGGTAG
jgi:hypothetical protein